MNNIEIKIYNNEESISICKTALIEFCSQIGFKRRDRHKIGVLFEELLKQLCACTFQQGQEGEIIVEMKVLEEGVEIKINDFGIPLDEKKIQKCKDKSKEALSGVYQLIESFMDDIQIAARGYKGNEVILRKYLHSRKHHRVESHEMHDETQKVTEIEAEIRALQEDFASEISKLAYFAYHYSYPYEDLYIPEKVREKINSRHLIPAGAVLSDSNQVVSHSALSLTHPHDKTAELGIAFTDPNYRGHGFINRIWSYLLNDVAKEKELFAVFAMAVCTHPYSQKACHKLGMNDCALLLSRAPEIEFESIDTSKSQRESIMITMKILNHPEDIHIYPPKHHKAMILQIADHVGMNVQTSNHPQLHFKHTHNFTSLDTKTDAIFRIAKIFINHYGKDCQHQVKNTLHQLKNQRFESIYIYLDLADFHTDKASVKMEELGFFFAGIMHENNRLNLVLQYLNNQSYDFKVLKIDSDFGNELLRYVETEYLKAAEK